jgi:hypothetical protein
MGREAASDTWIPVATAGGSVHRVLQALDDATRSSIEEALEECADGARSTVLLRSRALFQGSSPTAEDCMQWVKDETGRRMTLAMYLGLKMHEFALECARERLDKLWPGGFNIEPRYRYDEDTGRKRLISPEEERALEHSGNAGELLGTIKPDVVLHTGDPLEVRAIYDYKFPCVNTDVAPPWTHYSEGPHEGFNQGQVYEKVLGKRPARVVPRLGTIP